MSFVGATRSAVRPVIGEYARTIKYPVLLIGAGNFTIPAILRQAGYTGQIKACDVSLYSSALGAYLSDHPFEATENPECPDELRGLLKTENGRDELIASILLLFDLREVWQCKNAYQRHIVKNYREQWDGLIEKTLKKLSDYKEQIGQIDYEARDGIALLRESTREHTVITYPPTYKRGYEQLEKLYKATVQWNQPEYEEMTDKTMDHYHLIAHYNDYMIILDKDLEEVYQIVGSPTSVINYGRNTKGYIIRKVESKKYVLKREAASSPIGDTWPADQPITGSEKLTMVILNPKQNIRMNELFMSAHVNYSTQSSSAVGYCLDGKLIGKSDFVKGFKNFNWKLPKEGGQIYLMSDLAVPYDGKLAKLILMALLSRDVREYLETRFIERYRYVKTTAFSLHPVSMKYRGLFKLHKRTEVPDGYSLNYYAEFGDYPLQDAPNLWMKKYGK
ncbi:MAG: hypothetical protein JRC60_00475 [Deltaproteobacteria bacterium]|nr:hypothetical protein [Deltaproteobacteria bacterium]